MKIVHIELGKNLYGGARQVLYLLKGLKEKKVDNILICVKGSSIFKEAKNISTCYDIHYRGELDIRFLFKLKGILKKERPHLVHVHSRKAADIWGGLGCYFQKIPCILTRRVDNPEISLLARFKYSMFKKIVVISYGIRDVLLKEGVPLHKMVYIPSAVEVKNYEGECLRKWFLKEFNLDENTIPIGMVAQFIPRKGHEVMLTTIPKVLKEVPEARFLFFGKGPLLQKIKTMAIKTGILDKVRFAGFRDDMENLFPCLYMVVHPAFMEGLGVSLLQASASGIPVVATSVGGIPEVIKDGFNGFLVKPADTDMVAEKIICLLKDNHLASEMGKKGREYIKKKFSVNRMVNSYLSLYKEILGL